MNSIFTVFTICVAFWLPNNSQFENELHEVLKAKHISNQKVKKSDMCAELAQNYPNEWMAHYYASYFNILEVFETTHTSEIDSLLDSAEESLNRAQLLTNEPLAKSELACLQSMVASGRILVNPQVRGQKYGQTASKYMMEAIRFNSQNPRPYYLQALAALYMPKAYGGGCQPASELAQNALLLFNDFTVSSIVWPTWGKKESQELIDGCAK